MIKKILIPLLILMLFSCNKNSNTAAENTPEKIAAIIQNGDSLIYRYDNIGRLISRTAPEGNATYSYTPAAVTEKINTPNGLATLVYELNTQGLVSKSYKLDSAQFFTSYLYNTAGQVITEIYSGGSNSTEETTYYYAPSGNPDSAVVKKFGIVIKRKFFEFDPALPNVVAAEKFGITIYGKDAAHLIKKQTEIITSGNIFINTYEYEFDNAGRVIKIITRQPGTSLEEVTNYSY